MLGWRATLGRCLSSHSAAAVGPQVPLPCSTCALLNSETTDTFSFWSKFSLLVKVEQCDLTWELTRTEHYSCQRAQPFGYEFKSTNSSHHIKLGVIGGTSSKAVTFVQKLHFNILIFIKRLPPHFKGLHLSIVWAQYQVFKPFSASWSLWVVDPSAAWWPIAFGDVPCVYLWMLWYTLGRRASCHVCQGHFDRATDFELQKWKTACFCNVFFCDDCISMSSYITLYALCVCAGDCASLTPIGI